MFSFVISDDDDDYTILPNVYRHLTLTAVSGSCVLHRDLTLTLTPLNPRPTEHQLNPKPSHTTLKADLTNALTGGCSKHQLNPRAHHTPIIPVLTNATAGE